VRRAVEGRPVEAGLLRLKGTVSVGVAERLPEMADAGDLIKQSDQGAYLAKQRGRNRVVTSQSLAEATSP
jgi:PleD family two-component response regulator